MAIIKLYVYKDVNHKTIYANAYELPVAYIKSCRMDTVQNEMKKKKLQIKTKHSDRYGYAR